MVRRLGAPSGSAVGLRVGAQNVRGAGVGGVLRWTSASAQVLPMTGDAVFQAGWYWLRSRKKCTEKKGERVGLMLRTGWLLFNAASQQLSPLHLY